jgi:hypothetical protein
MPSLAAISGAFRFARLGAIEPAAGELVMLAHGFQNGGMALGFGVLALASRLHRHRIGHLADQARKVFLFGARMRP